jgi:Permease MlaE
VLTSIREFGPSVTVIILAGVAGTAITADLGARKIREELDALQVLGVDPVKNLVVPRFLALMIVTELFDSDKGMTASGGAEGGGPLGEPGRGDHVPRDLRLHYVFTQTLLATHPKISVIK